MAKSKAAQALEFAQEIFLSTPKPTWIHYHNALYGNGGKLSELFKTPSERTAFSQTPQAAEIGRMAEQLQGPEVEASGTIVVRGPKTLHKALLDEAEREGVSLNQLCVSKLSMQLAALVH